MRAAGNLGRFARDEQGAGTSLSLMIFVILAMVLGLAVDSTNGWRNRTYLTSTADMGAHAGAVALANDMTQSEIISEVERVVSQNMPTSFFGQVLDATTDVTFAYYDPITKAFDASASDYNTIVVRLERTRARGNPIGTFLMRFAGSDALEAKAVSAAVFDVNGDCSSTDGIFAQDQVTLTSQTNVGAGFCIHSQARVWLPQNNTFEEGSFVTMPKLALCEDKCQDSANPGIVAIEANMVLPNINEWITTTYNAFLGGMGNPIKSDFFTGAAAIPSADVQLLRDQGILNNGQPDPIVGDVITMTNAEFHTMPYLPSGLVYEIDCANNGNGPSTRLEFNNTTGIMHDAALMTDCSLHFNDGAEVVGSVLVTMREATTATVSSGSSVVVADPTLGCVADDRTVVMSMSKLSVPAEFVMSNVTLVVDDDVDIAAASAGAIASRGLSIYSSGRVHVSSQHTFQTCPGTDPAFLSPYGKVLRLVIPPAS